MLFQKKYLLQVIHFSFPEFEMILMHLHLAYLYPASHDHEGIGNCFPKPGFFLKVAHMICFHKITSGKRNHFAIVTSQNTYFSQ